MSITAAIIDNREPDWIKKLTFGDVPVTCDILETGDVWIVTDDNKMLIFERKTPNDFLGSLADERLFAQAARLADLRKQGHWPYFLITGQFINMGGKVYTDRETGWNWNSVEGGLLTLQEMGLFVTHCPGDTEFESAIVRIADRNRDEKTLIPPARLAKVLGLQAAFLCGLPGIGPEKVNEILDHCQTPAIALVGLTDDRIKIPGIGPGIRNNVRFILGLRTGEQIELACNDQNDEVLAIYENGKEKKHD